MGYCPSCGVILHQHEETQDVCPYCNFSMNHIKDDEILWIKCPDCEGEVQWGDAYCSDCKKDFPDSFWRSWITTEQTQTPSYSSDEPNWMLKGQRWLKLTEDYNLCCNRVWFKCDCEEPISWEDYIQNLEPEIKNIVYDQSARNRKQCEDCEYYHDRRCLPLRAWLKEYLIEGYTPGAIDICINYEPWHSVDIDSILDVHEVVTSLEYTD